MDAQLSGFVTGDLSFQASGSVTASSGSFRYTYGVYAFYNIGYSATATILGLFNWSLSPRKAYNPDQRINIYGPVSGEIPLTSSSKRSIGDDSAAYGLNQSLVTLGEYDAFPAALFPRAGPGAGLGMYKYQLPRGPVSGFRDSPRFCLFDLPLTTSVPSSSCCQPSVI